MASEVVKAGAACPKCGTRVSATLRHCPTCGTDLGPPNVRDAKAGHNLEALTSRFDKAKTRAALRGCSEICDRVLDLLERESGVVISMPAGVALKLVEDPNMIYQNYERLVGIGARKPAELDRDRQRSAVGGLLFGSYANMIRYGLLSLTGAGLSTYGEVHCRLRSVAIDERTTFLETNSFRFIDDHKITPDGQIPGGYQSSWHDRHLLVMAKIADQVETGQTPVDWQNLLVFTDGQDRGKDDCIEAHIFDGFDVKAIESMVPVADKGLSGYQKTMRDIAIGQFKDLVEARR